MEHVTQEKANIKAGTAEVSTVDLLKMVGHLAKDQLSRVRVPALTFTFPRDVMRNYWGAFWDGRTLPFKFKINDEIQKDIFIGRLGFATTFIIADSIYLVGRFGVWLLKKLPWKLNVWNIVLVAGLVVGFLGWVMPWWLDYIGAEVRTSGIMKIVGKIQKEFRWERTEVIGDYIRWFIVIPVVGALPFSVARLRRWKGLKQILKEKSKPIVEGKEE